LQRLTRTVASVERKLSNLFKAIEKDGLRLDAHLKGRIADLQDEREKLAVRVADLKIKVAVPKDLLADVSLAAFSASIRAALSDRSSATAKAILRLFVDEDKDLQQRKARSPVLILVWLTF